MTVIIDRRDEPVSHKFGKDKARFLRRIRKAAEKAIQEKISEGSIKDFEKGGVKVPVPKATTQEPVIHHDQGPNFGKVFPGNLYNLYRDGPQYAGKVFPGNVYEVGDTVPVPKGGGGGRGTEGSPDAEDDQDDFVWLPEDEFLDILFEGRSLPDMVKLNDEAIHVIEKERAGHISRGPSHRMDMDVTNKKRRSDALVLHKSSERRLLDILNEQYKIYRKYKPDLPELNLKGKNKSEKLKLVKEVLQTLQNQFAVSVGKKYKNETLTTLFNCIDTLQDNVAKEVTHADDLKRLEVLRSRVPEQIKTAKNADKFQSNHLTYHFDEDIPKPATKAVMFCKMDVSASMGEEEKNIAKVFFWVLHRFLKENYEEVDVIFITHTTTAEETDEQEFFYGDRTGGTLVSSCLEKELEIIKERYPVGEWNIYSAQASDGDNYSHDNYRVEELMEEILPLQQASYFIEVEHPYWRGERRISELHQTYMNIAERFPKLKTKTVGSPGEALDAFTEFFPVNGKTNENKPALG